MNEERIQLDAALDAMFDGMSQSDAANVALYFSASGLLEAVKDTIRHAPQDSLEASLPVIAAVCGGVQDAVISAAVRARAKAHMASEAQS